MGTRKKSGSQTETVIPDKLYFRIGEVARLADLPTYVLRFWETEFPQLKPVKSSTGQRMYRRREVELALHIKELLYEQGFTIPGAREQLKAETRPEKAQSSELSTNASPEHLQRVRHGLREILAILERPPQSRQRRASGAD